MLSKRAKLAIISALAGADAGDPDGGDFPLAGSGRYPAAALEVRQERQSTRRALKLLRDAATALEEECSAAGPDEVKVHPTLRRHAQVAQRIREFVKAWEGK